MERMPARRGLARRRAPPLGAKIQHSFLLTMPCRTRHYEEEQRARYYFRLAIVEDFRRRSYRDDLIIMQHAK